MRLFFNRVLRRIFKEFKRIVLSPFIRIFTFATRVIVRFFIIRKYFLENDSRKLHLGAGSSVNLGWLTSDLSPKITGRTIYIDATKKLPFKDNSFDFVYCEHMIEHISYDQASRMLEECNRVMKKGAKIRISTPDLDKYLSLFESNISPIQEDFIVFMKSNWLSRFKFDNDKDLPYHILNLNMHAWGHQYIYCYSTLSEQLIKKRFVSLERYDNDCSNNRTLSKLEKHAYTLEKRGIKDAARMVNFETMNVEATKQ